MINIKAHYLFHQFGLHWVFHGLVFSELFDGKVVLFPLLVVPVFVMLKIALPSPYSRIVSDIKFQITTLILSDMEPCLLCCIDSNNHIFTTSVHVCTIALHHFDTIQYVASFRYVPRTYFKITFIVTINRGKAKKIYVQCVTCIWWNQHLKNASGT